METRIEQLFEQMTLEEKASLLSGADTWHTRSIERLGIPAIRMTDGPHGVRRPYDDDTGSLPATSFPTASAMAATWNPDLMREIGEALALETKSKDCDVLLGPAVNIHRTPLCGRNFEYYSEDPYLTGRMAVAYIQGLQSQNVGASLKHFAANNSEFERMTISSEVDERALREIYLPAFEAAVKEADPWTVMCSYNKINGTWASENRYLLTEILRDEWGYQGMVVSDWGAVHNRILTTKAGLDLEMPGLGEMPVEILVNAVRSGLLDEALIDKAVRRILRLVFRARGGGQEKTLDPDAANISEHRELARRTAGEAVVLLKNERNLLPIEGRKVRSIAVIGPNAAAASIQGGGSARVNPYYTVSPLEGIRRRAGDSIRVEFTQGCKHAVNPARLDSAHVTAPETGEPGFLASYYNNSDFSGEPFLTRVEPVVHFQLHTLPAEQSAQGSLTARWQGKFTAPVNGEYLFSVSSAGQSRVLVDSAVVADHWAGPDLISFMSVWPFKSKKGVAVLEAGKTYDLVVEYKPFDNNYRLSAGYDIPLPADEIERAARLAAQSDIAVVCAGTTWEHECEGYDREEWELPGDQARLIEAVAKANPRTVVVLNHGAVHGIASWAGKVPAIVETWYTGQEIGSAVADVLFGDVNPSGKLPDTFPVHYQDNPAFLNYPGENGRVLYGEGIFVGYRYFDAKDIEPLFPFGFGLSYTTFAYENLRISAETIDPQGSLIVEVAVRNTGSRAGKEVVQLYIRDLESRLVRPPKELKGFRKIELAPGEMKTVSFTITEKELSYYDPSQKAWVAEPGEFEALIGSSSRDIYASARFTLNGGPVKPRPRLNGESTFQQVYSDPQGRKVLEKYLPEIISDPQVQARGSRYSLNRISFSFMELLPPDRLQQIVTELEQIE